MRAKRATTKARLMKSGVLCTRASTGCADHHTNGGSVKCLPLKIMHGMWRGHRSWWLAEEMLLTERVCHSAICKIAFQCFIYLFARCDVNIWRGMLLVALTRVFGYALSIKCLLTEPNQVQRVMLKRSVMNANHVKV